jgi:hypothetical protein
MSWPGPTRPSIAPPAPVFDMDGRLRAGHDKLRATTRHRARAWVLRRTRPLPLFMSWPGLTRPSIVPPVLVFAMDGRLRAGHDKLRATTRHRASVGTMENATSLPLFMSWPGPTRPSIAPPALVFDMDGWFRAGHAKLRATTPPPRAGAGRKASWMY